LERTDAAIKIEEIYKKNLSKEEFEKKRANISKLLDKYDGKYDKLINAMNRKYASNASAPESEKEEVSEKVKPKKPASKVSDGTHSGFAESNKEARKAAIANKKAKKKAAIAKEKEMKNKTKRKRKQKRK